MEPNSAEAVTAGSEILGLVLPVSDALGCSLHINAKTPGGIQTEDGGTFPVLCFDCRRFFYDVAHIARALCGDASASSRCAHALPGIGNLSSAL